MTGQFDKTSPMAQTTLHYNGPYSTMPNQSITSQPNGITQKKRVAENLKHHYALLTLLTEPNRTLSTQELEDTATAFTEAISTTNKQAARV